MFCLDVQFALQFVLVCFPAKTFKEMIHLNMKINYLLTHAIPNQTKPVWLYKTQNKLWKVFWGKISSCFCPNNENGGPKQCQSLLTLTVSMTEREKKQEKVTQLGMTWGWVNDNWLLKL